MGCILDKGCLFEKGYILENNQTRGLVSKETVVLCRWGHETQKFWIYQLS